MAFYRFGALSEKEIKKAEEKIGKLPISHKAILKRTMVEDLIVDTKIRYL